MEMELRPYEQQVVRKRGTGYFWWTALLLLLAGACFASWLGSFYVVAHPEVPACYRFLKKLKRLDPPKRFPVTEAPRGEFLTPFRLLERFGKMGPAELERENAELLRAYIMNYRETKRQVVYVTGKYDVVQTHLLQPGDFFPTGVALVAQAVEHPQMAVEALFPAGPKTVPKIQAAMPTGSDFNLERSRDLFALLHVTRLDDGRMQFTTVPLPYGGWRIKNRSIEFALQSPEELEAVKAEYTINIEAGLPLVRGEKLTQGLAAYAAFRRKALASAGDDQKTLAAPELERFEVRDPNEPPGRVATQPRAPVPTQSAIPATNGAASPSRTAVVAPAPTPRPVPTPAPAVPLPPRPVVRSLPPSGAAVTPTPVAVAPPTPPTPVPAPAVAQERRVLTTAQASALVEQFSGSAPSVLAGEFVVTGVLGQRVALRTRESLRDAKADPTQPGTSAALVVVDFPPGTTPPAKDSVVTRDGERGFEVRDVIRGKNGQIMIVVGEKAR